MRVLVCIKRVPAPGARINVSADALSVDVNNLGFTTSPHEECALEEAVQIVERAREAGASSGLGNAEDSYVTVLTLGPPQATEQLRYAASVGGHRFVLLDTSEEGENAWGPRATAMAIAEAVTEIEDVDGAFDLILFGNESADSGGFQVGIRVARALDRPSVNGIKAIEVNDGTLRARREIDGGFEVYEVPTPAVFGVKEGINLPRYPTMKGRLKSKKAVIDERSVEADDASDAVRVALRRPVEQASETVVLGSGSSDEDIAAAASAIVDLLAELELSS